MQIEITTMPKAWSMVVLIFMFAMLCEVQGGQPQATSMTPEDLSSDLYPVQTPMAGMQTEISKSVWGINMFRTIVSVTVIFIVGLLTGFWWQMSKKVEPPPPQQQPPHESNAEASSHGTHTSSPREPQVGSTEMFTLQEILTMTDFFKVVLGQGGQGTVYEATLPGPEPQEKVAVKKLDRNRALDGVRSNSGEEIKNQDSIEKEFWSELRSISRLHHNNLVALLGYCIEGDQLFLIYEFMENGSLQHHLHKKSEEIDSGHLFDWHQRMQVAMEVAQGLEYLHNYAKPTLVHRDIKPSNILFDADMHAKIADFGLSKTQAVDPTTSMCLKGTPGYVDPDYYATGRSNEKNDVYSYGVVLLELVTGKKAIERQKSLVDWCREFLDSDPEVWPVLLPKMVDDRINPGEYLQPQLLAVVQLAMACVDDEPDRRPSMREVMKRLIIADCEDASSSEISTEDSLSNNGGLSNRISGSPQAHTYTRASSSNGWSTYVITETSVTIKYIVGNKKLAVRCKIWPTMQNLGLNKIEATLDDALMWKKGLWFYNASSSREFSVDEVKLRAEWQVGLRFRRHLLKPGDPRRHQGPFCIEYLGLKDAQGEPFIEYHGDRSPRYPQSRESSVEPSTTAPLQRRRSSITQDSSLHKRTRKSLANLAPR